MDTTVTVKRQTLGQSWAKYGFGGDSSLFCIRTLFFSYLFFTFP
jgi:hypothetical protein